MNTFHLLPILFPLLAVCAHCHATEVVVADGGMKIRVVPSGATFSLPPPELYLVSTNLTAPGNCSSDWSPLAQWPGGTKGEPLALGFTPRYDDDGSLILGGAFRQLLPESVIIKPAEGGDAFINGRDYILNAEWAQVAALAGRLGTPGSNRIDIAASIALQRIDLVQVDAGGTPSVRQGVSRLVCPERPDPAPGCRALAGVYIAPWRRGGVWTVTQDDILPVRLDSPLVMPVRPEAARNTLAKLRAGEKVKIAFIGDSITLGAEAGPWWRDDSATFRGRVLRTLRERFPQATIEEIQAFKGGRGITYVHEAFSEIVEPAKPDLVVIGIGINDAHAEQDGRPTVPIEAFKPLFAKLVERAKTSGAEVIVHTSMETNPFDANGDAHRWPEYREAMLCVAERRGVGVADTGAVWQNQRLCGVPPFSQLHNWINHPGSKGHGLFAETVLQFFPK
jgi:lysophospholipase L1-like esterase